MSTVTGEAEWAIFLAAVCGQTYTQFDNAEGAFVVPEGFSAVHSFQAKSMGNVWELFGFILESQQEIIIAWRGSISTNDWLSNMNAAQKIQIHSRALPDPSGVHRYLCIRPGCHSLCAWHTVTGEDAVCNRP